MHKILLADDTKVTLSVEKAYLESRDFRVFATTSPSEVTHLAGVIQPDLIVLDFDMPGMTGEEVCRRLKSVEETSHIPVLILSSHEDDETQRICLAAGAIDFARKTEGREALLGHVARILGLPQRRYLRAPCRFSVNITESGASFEGMVHDICEGGLYLTADRLIGEGTALQLRFELPDREDEIRLLAEAVRSEILSGSMYGCGIMFLEADAEAIEALRAFVRRSV